MQPYVIRQGDFLAKLAHQFGFDADAVWKDSANDQLRQLRSDPNVLCPTDILYIPEPQQRFHDLTIGTTNAFVSNVPTVDVSLSFVDPAYASQPFEIGEVPELVGLTTAGDGAATFTVPVTLETFSVKFTQLGATFQFKIGHLDPINSLSGIFQRLRNLGYLAHDAQLDDPPDLDEIRAALRAFKAAQGGGSGDTPSSGNAQGGNAPDDGGLTNDGKLDSSTADLLLKAHSV